MNIDNKTCVNDERDVPQHSFYIVETHAIARKSMGENDYPNMYTKNI